MMCLVQEVALLDAFKTGVCGITVTLLFQEYAVTEVDHYGGVEKHSTRTRYMK